MTKITEDERSVANAGLQSCKSRARKNKKGQPLTLTLNFHMNLSHFSMICVGTKNVVAILIYHNVSNYNIAALLGIAPVRYKAGYDTL
jgi:hypothetical protein